MTREEKVDRGGEAGMSPRGAARHVCDLAADGYTSAQGLDAAEEFLARWLDAHTKPSTGPMPARTRLTTPAPAAALMVQRMLRTFEDGTRVRAAARIIYGTRPVIEEGTEGTVCTADFPLVPGLSLVRWDGWDALRMVTSHDAIDPVEVQP